MKKLLSIALALVLMLTISTTAFATTITQVEDEMIPGTVIKLTADDFVPESTETPISDSEDRNYFTSEYFSIDIDYEMGSSLVSSVAFDDDGYLVITLKDTYRERPSIANFQIEEITLKAKKDGYNSTKSDKYVLVGNKDASAIGCEVVVEDIDTDGTLTIYPYYDTIIEIGDGYGVSYGTLEATVTDFYDDVFYIEGRVYSGEKFLFSLNNDVDIDLVKANPSANIDFYNFVKAPEFSSNMDIEFYPAYEDEFVYEVINGELVVSSLEWDDDYGCFRGKSSSLSQNYIVSDIELTSVVYDTETEDEDEYTKNPDTGSKSFVGLAVALAGISAVGIGLSRLKK